MKRFLERQGYEVVWLKDVTIKREKLDKALYNAQRTNIRSLKKPGLTQKMREVFTRHFISRQKHIDRFEKEYNFPGFHDGKSNILECVTKQQDQSYNDLSKLERDYRPTKTNLVEKLRQLSDITQSGDYAFFYFSGHGDRRLGSNRLLLTPENGKKNMWSEYWATIKDTTLYNNFTVRLPEGSHAVLMFDACHSGRMGNLRFRLNQDTGASWETHGKSRTWPQAKVISISGCNDGELSTESEHARQGGFLTKFFLDAVRFSSPKSDNVTPEKYQTRKEHPFHEYVHRMWSKMKISPLLRHLRNKVRLALDEGDHQTPQIECSFKIDASQKCLGEFLGPRPVVD